MQCGVDISYYLSIAILSFDFHPINQVENLVSLKRVRSKEKRRLWCKDVVYAWLVAHCVRSQIYVSSIIELKYVKHPPTHKTQDVVI